MTVDISDWNSEDWVTQMRLMAEWMLSKSMDVDAVWPNQKELLTFDRTEDAIEFILRWA